MARRKRGQLVHYNVTFKDHTGEPALMSWTGLSCDESLLPPLSSWVFYMVNPAVRPGTFDGAKFKLDYEGLNWEGGRRISSHYEFFFLPGATAEECVAHYRDEMLARGTIWKQIHELQDAKAVENPEDVQAPLSIFDSPVRPVNLLGKPTRGTKYTETLGEDQGLPGLVWPINSHDYTYTSNYRGWFFIYPHADTHWEKPERYTREMYLTQFHPVPDEDLEEDEVVTFDPMQHPIRSRLKVARGGGVHGPETIATGEFEGCESVLRWMSEQENSCWQQAAQDATEYAREIGWQSW